ncbi:MAG: mycofactocin biosynthesis chaperone MftB [Nitrospiraceae bacterium]|nr:mycofactocin biosynthesis chaperone MftB [Nitrospiraceae bacterium]
MANERLSLNPRISVRPESFGALCYNFATRDLFLIKSRLALRLAELAKDGIDRAEAELALGTRPDQFTKLVDALAAKQVILVSEATGSPGNE